MFNPLRRAWGPAALAAACIACALALGAAAAPATQPATRPATQPTVQELTAARVAERLALARTELAAIPEDAPQDAPDGQRRAALARRIALFEEWQRLNASAELSRSQGERTGQRLQAVRAQLAALSAQAPATAPLEPTKAGFEALKAAIAQQREQAATLRRAVNDMTERLGDASGRAAEARERGEEADRRAARLAEEKPEDPALAKVQEMRIANARLDRYVALKAQELVQIEAESTRQTLPAISAEQELAELRLERSEEEFDLYARALSEELDRQLAAKRQELSRRRREAVSAVTPAERFLAQWEAWIVESDTNRSDLEPLLLWLKTQASEQERNLIAERADFDSLQDFLRLAGGSSRATDRVAAALQQIRARRNDVARIQAEPNAQAAESLIARRFDIEDALAGAGDRYRRERDAVVEELSGIERVMFLDSSAPLLDRYRTGLREEKAMVGEAMALSQQLQTLLLERAGKADEMERFIRATAFWLRDGKPLLSGRVPLELWQESRRLAAWGADAVSVTVVDHLARQVRDPAAVLYALLLFPLLPAGLFYARQRLRRYVRGLNDQTLDTGRNPAARAAAIVAGVLSAAILPAYLFFAAQFVATAWLPPEIAPVASMALGHVSLFLLLWFLVRSFFAGSGILQVQAGLPADASHLVHRCARMALLGYLLLLAPWFILRRPPFYLEALPRIGYTLFEIVAAVAILRLIRQRGALMQRVIAAAGDGFIARRWRLVTLLVAALLLAIVWLDVAGYRYGAASMAGSFLSSLGTLAVLVPLFFAARSAIVSMAAQRRAGIAEEEATARRLTGQRIIRVVRISMLLLGAWLIAAYWGLDLRAFDALDEMHLYVIRTGAEGEEYLSWGDLLRFVLWGAGTLWALWALPGVYEFAIFPRLRLDAGLKYAVLTISRYAAFAFGSVWALSAIHLDLGRLGWLMAAVGVGLGFGLQEIVSNFVCGIILLVERPIQVGDLVTIGTMSGTVTRINIRATTILNSDRQEVIVPNRSLITGEVTNWTRGDTINRMVFPVGVAYGSNVEQVTKILLDVAASQREVLRDPPPTATLMKFGDSSMDFELRLFIPEPSVMLPLRHRINKAIESEFARHGISMPFPQRDLHIVSGDAKLPALALPALGKSDVPVDVPQPAPARGARQ